MATATGGRRRSTDRVSRLMKRERDGRFSYTWLGPCAVESDRYGDIGSAGNGQEGAVGTDRERQEELCPVEVDGQETVPGRTRLRRYSALFFRRKASSS